MPTRYQPDEALLLYVLGLVIIATHPGRLWLGMALAGVPIITGVLLRTFRR
jgi:hypothetical protein